MKELKEYLDKNNLLTNDYLNKKAYELQVDSEIFFEYKNKLYEHIIYVFEAGKKHFNIEFWEHDQSKFSHKEFFAYALNFHYVPLNNKDETRIKNNFQYAWLHHVNNNAHHWQYWIIPEYQKNNKNLKNITNSGIFKMPLQDNIEMVSDWLGASRAYTGSWDMQDWLKDNFYKIKLHPITKKNTIKILKELGYYVC